MKKQTQSNLKIKNMLRYLFLAVKLTLILIIMSNISCSEKTPPPKKNTLVKNIDIQKLAGRWLRPDGGYILEISEIKEDGSIMAAYFNPKSINVAESYWQRQESRLQVFVKFDDVNYSGSTYTLEYLPGKNRLIGVYYQATMGKEFYVEFNKME